MIPFVDLKAQYRSIKEEIDGAIAGVLESAAFALGPAVARFEKRFADYCGTRHAVAVNSGTSALHLALLAAGVGAGDEVLVPAMTFVATAAAVRYTGARPVLVDVDPRTCTMDPERLPAAIGPRTKAVLPVHLYGQPADMDPILAFAEEHGLLVVEDAAQAHGAEYRGRRCGSIGDLAGFSFYPGKNLGAYGEGGAVTTDREDLAESVRVLRDWGQERKGRHDRLGFNYRMAGIQGAVLGVKLGHLERWTELRREAAAAYRERLRDLPEVEVPAARGDSRHVYHIFAVLLEARDEVRRLLGERGVATGVHYPLPIHLQPCFHDLGHRAGEFPAAERIAARELSLPMFPELGEERVERVVAALSEVTREV